MEGIVNLLPILALSAAFGADPAHEFTTSIRPVLEQNCGSCHNPADPKNRIDFLKAQGVKDIESKRTMWRSVAAQLRNRTMPPMASKLTEDDRLKVSALVDNLLRDTACSAGDYAGAVAPRRLNRREYRRTPSAICSASIFTVTDLFPADESAGAGFDTNGETLYVPPMMLERYMEAAGKVLDRVIVTPPLSRVFADAEVTPPPQGPLPNGKPGRMLQAGEAVSVKFSVYSEDKYNIPGFRGTPARDSLRYSAQSRRRGGRQDELRARPQWRANGTRAVCHPGARGASGGSRNGRRTRAFLSHHRGAGFARSLRAGQACLASPAVRAGTR